MDVVKRFDARLGRILPSDENGKALRAEAVRWMREVAEDVRAKSPLPGIQSKLPWVAANERAYVADAELRADRLADLLENPAGGSIVRELGEFYAVLSTATGNPSARFTIGSFFVVLPATMLVVTAQMSVIFWAVATGEMHHPANVDAVMHTTMVSTSAAAGVGLAAIFVTKPGRALVRKMASGFGDSNGRLRIEAAFWARLHKSVRERPELSAYVPENDDEFPSYFLSRLQFAGDPVADCDSWLQQPPVVTAI